MVRTDQYGASALGRALLNLRPGGSFGRVDSQSLAGGASPESGNRLPLLSCSRRDTAVVVGSTVAGFVAELSASVECCGAGAVSSDRRDHGVCR